MTITREEAEIVLRVEVKTTLNPTVTPAWAIEVGR